jgi:hypothetical protein
MMLPYVRPRKIPPASPAPPVRLLIAGSIVWSVLTVIIARGRIVIDRSRKYRPPTDREAAMESFRAGY